jgi:serine/threonine protein phosphatase 1
MKISLKRARKGPRLPPGMRIYAVGDIHGRADLVSDLFTRIDAHHAAHPIRKPVQLFLGDYIDRGPDSREVLDLLVARARSTPAVFLKGNHEKYFIDFLSDPSVLDHWQRLGGLETLLSYGLIPSINPTAAMQTQLSAALDRKLPESHREFFRNLQLSFTCGDFFFVHAGVRPGIPLSKQREEDLLWIRYDFLLHEERHEKVIVHGHTPVTRPEVHTNRINIDTGAYATGQLTCLVLEESRISFI